MARRPTVYLETSVISYLVSRPSRNLIVLTHQQLTRQWWNHRRDQFELFVSELVVEEVSHGDPQAVARRSAMLDETAVLDSTPGINELALRMLAGKAFPEKAVVDAGHVATAAYYGIEYLLTWNCTHINNAQIKGAIESVCRARGYRCPVICTPEELLGERP